MLLIFKILKLQNIHFVGNLILNTCCKFYSDDLNVTLFMNIKCGSIAVENIL